VLRRFIRAFAFVSIFAAATACGSITAADEPDSDPPANCTSPAPEPGMVCRGDTWAWG
jgi:hypothetical protein